MARFSSDEARVYWKDHARIRAPLDLDRDPDALNNVCCTDAPSWLNAHYAISQEKVFRYLLGLVPATAGCRALDIGCGAGRWCRALAARGCCVTGIDLQRDLIKQNQVRLPDMAFHLCPIQEFTTAEPFDLVTAVTVLAHIPSEEQPMVAERIRGLLNESGFCVLLENLRDNGPHVWSNSIEGWRNMFEHAGLSLVATARYDYNPALRMAGVLRRAGSTGVRVGRGATIDVAPDQYMVRAFRRDPVFLAARRFETLVLRAATLIDGPVENCLLRRNAPLPSRHCGFLFRARPKRMHR